MRVGFGGEENHEQSGGGCQLGKISAVKNSWKQSIALRFMETINGKDALRMLMDLAANEAKILMQSGIKAPCFFICDGVHGNARFDFESPENKEIERLLFDRMFFNILGCNATEAVTAITQHVKLEPPKCIHEQTNHTNLSKQRELLVINGESGTQRISRALPIFRGTDGHFMAFGTPWEKTYVKEAEQDVRYIAGVALTGPDRFDALEQAGNAEIFAELARKRLKSNFRGRSL